MKTLAFLLAIGIFGIAFANDKDAELVKVYCFSADLEAGFSDDSAEYWCKELGKRGSKKKSLALVDSKEDANVLVQYLGTKETTTMGDATYLVGGYAWTPEQTKKGAKAVVAVGDFVKGFHGEGINWQGPGAIMRQIEEWVRENRDTILEKAKKN